MLNNLGKTIKEARIAKKMTQADVVGTFITRNMLSQIESGNAYPSFKTLKYLSEVLGLPVITQDNGTETTAEVVNDDLSCYLSGKNAYMEKDYSKAITLLTPIAEKMHPLSDEAVALVALSYLATAKEAVRSDSRAAIINGLRAKECAEKGLFASREVRTEAALLLDTVADNL